MLTYTRLHNRIGLIDIRDNTNDDLIVQEVWRENQYRLPEEIKGVVIDIGGHNGTFNVVAGRLGGRVYSYEPVKDNYDELVKNIKLNGLSTNTYNLAVTSDGRDVKLSPHENKINLGGFTLDNEGEIEAKSVSIHEVLKHDSIAILKLDCEGSEYEILEAMTKEEFDKVKSIRMEYHGSKDKGVSLSQKFESLGFSVSKYDQGHLGIIIAVK